MPEPPTYTASGTVTDNQGDPVPDVDVIITDPASGEQTTATTDDDGTWSVDDLEPATGYTAEVQTPPGYTAPEPPTLTFDLDDDTTDLDFTLALLEPTPTPTPTPTSASPEPTPTSTTPSPDPIANDDYTDDTSDDDNSSSSSGSLASTGGPSILIGVIGLLLVAAGAFTVITKARSRNR